MSNRVAAALLFFLSGAVLVMEILAARLLGPVVGLSLETYTAIIGVVLAGISGGHAVGGRVADRFPWRTTLGPCVVLGGLFALAVVPVTLLLGAGVARPTVGDAMVLAIAAFSLPTATLSAASPIIMRARIRDLDHTGRTVGSLSAASTAGALAGTFLTGFVLVVSFPTTRILYWLSAVLIVVGVVLLPRRGLLRGTMLVTLAVVAATLAEVVPSPCDAETRYYCAKVRVASDDPSARVLQLDRLSHSYVDLDDPSRLGFRYQRVVGSVLDGIRPPAEPVRVLHIGGGGFAFPRYVASTRPGSINRVLELDPDLPGLAARRLDFAAAPRVSRTGDARTALRAPEDDVYDLVVADAFGSLDPPWHLATVETAELVRRRLSTTGVYAANIVDAGDLRFLRAEVATLRQVFPHVAVVMAPRGRREIPSNTIIVASAGPATFTVDPKDGRVLAADEVDDLARRGQVLTDDFAPVERLVSRDG